MKLYYSTGTCSLSPHIILNEAGIKFDLVKVDLKAKTYANGQDYRQVNSKGAVPALEIDNGEVLTEGAVLVQYIADLVPEKKLIPTFGTMERYRCQEWLNYIASEIHKSFSPLWNRNLSEEARANAMTLLTNKFPYLESRLAKQNYCMGSTFSVVDAYLFTVLNWSKHLKVDLSPYPALLGFIERIASRPAVQAAMTAEGLKR